MNAMVTHDAVGLNNGVSVMQMKLLNAVAFVFTVGMNGISAAGILSKFKIGEVSDMHPNKIVPASGAFSIWSVIYTLEGLFILYCLFCWPSQADAVLLHGVGFWFAATCLFNCLWIVTFVQGNDASLWCATCLIFMLLFCLCKMYLGAECWVRRRPGGTLQRVMLMAVLDVHFSMYAGWVTVASIVATSATLTSTGWKGEPLTESAWSVVMLCVALGLNAYIVITRSDCVWGFVLAWASAWIAVENDSDTAVVTGSLVVCSLITLIATVVTAKVVWGAWNSPAVDPDEEDRGTFTTAPDGASRLEGNGSAVPEI